MVRFIRVPRENKFSLTISDRQPLMSTAAIWSSLAQLATIGIFILLSGAFLNFGRGLLLPICAAAVIGTTLFPIIRKAGQYGAPAWLTSTLLVGMICAGAGLAVTLLAGPVSEWITRAPELSGIVKQKLYVLDLPLTALRELRDVILPRNGNTITVDTGVTEFLTPVVAFLTPAASQVVLFLFVLLLFLINRPQLRQFLVGLMPSRDAKLRLLRIDNDIEHNLAGYLAIVTLVNLALGVIVAAGTWLLGFPRPHILGLLAMMLNFIPYIGPGITTLTLFAIGLVVFPTLGQALIAPAVFVAVASVEGHVVTPTIVGRRLTLNPLIVVLNLAFWTWLWGPAGAFLALPLSIIALVTVHHLLPDNDMKIPE